MTALIDRLTYEDVAKTIDHSLLRPELDDEFITEGCELAARYKVASVCVRPADGERAAKLLAGTEVAVGTGIGFPHGSTTTEVKLFGAEQAMRARGSHLYIVINMGALPSGRDTYVKR